MTEPNLIEEVCKKYAISKDDLASEIGASASTIKNSASNGEISEKTRVAIELWIENQELKKKLGELEQIKTFFRNFLK